jgi:integrase
MPEIEGANGEINVNSQSIKPKGTLVTYGRLRAPSPFVVTTERSQRTSSYALVNKFAGWYRALGFSGASSHSGRRTAITLWARRISTLGGSLRDVQLLAGHSALGTTQRYIEGSDEAKRRVVEMV